MGCVFCGTNHLRWMFHDVLMSRGLVVTWRIISFEAYPFRNDLNMTTPDIVQ